jgi:hypothetical protein
LEAHLLSTTGNVGESPAGEMTRRVAGTMEPSKQTIHFRTT